MHGAKIQAYRLAFDYLENSKTCTGRRASSVFLHTFCPKHISVRVMLEMRVCRHVKCLLLPSDSNSNFIIPKQFYGCFRQRTDGCGEYNKRSEGFRMATKTAYITISTQSLDLMTSVHVFRAFHHRPLFKL